MDELPLAEKGYFVSDQLPPYEEGSIARLQCPANHISKHSRSILISEEGVLKWDPPFGFCLPVLYTLPVAEHGEFFNITAPPYYENDISFLECFTGYTTETVVRSTVVMKEGVLQWQPPSAACVALLSTLPEAHHGQFRSGFKAPYNEGAVAHLYCFEDYATKSPIQSKVVFKKGILQWDPPFAECFPILYDMPAAEHAVYYSETSPFFEGDIAYFQGCEEGHSHFWGKDSIATRIGDRLEWRPPGVECWPFTYDLPVAEHGYFTDGRMGGSFRYYEDDEVTLLCSEGYGSKMVQYSILKKIEGVLQWVPPSAKCVPILETLPAAEHGWWSCHETAPYVEGNVARLTCQEGYLPSSISSESIATLVKDQLMWVPDFMSCLRDPNASSKNTFFRIFWILVLFLLVSLFIWIRWNR